MANKIPEKQYNELIDPNPIIISGNIYDIEEYNDSRWYYSQRESFEDYNNSQIKFSEDSSGNRVLIHKYVFKSESIDMFNFSVIKDGTSKYVGKGKNRYGNYMYKVTCIHNRMYSFNIEVKYYKLESPKSVKQINSFSIDQIHTSRKRKSFDLSRVHNELTYLVCQPRKTRSFSGAYPERKQAEEIQKFLDSL